jgi:hypothetical protein
MSRGRKSTARRQRPVKGGRRPSYVGLIPELEREIRAAMRRFNVTRSFALEVAAADGVGVREQERFVDDDARLRVVRRRA